MYWAKKTLRSMGDFVLVKSRIGTLLGEQYNVFSLASKTPGWPYFGYANGPLQADGRRNYLRGGTLPPAGYFVEDMVSRYINPSCVFQLDQAYHRVCTLADRNDSPFYWWDVFRQRKTLPEIEWEVIGKTPLQRLEYYQTIEPGSVYPDPGYFVQLASFLFYILLIHILWPVIEESLKRYAKYHVDVYVAEITLRVGYKLTHWASSETVLVSLLALTAVFLPALCLSLFESRGKISWNWFLCLCSRTVAHAMLLDFPFYTACVVHVMYNLLMYSVPEYQLRMRAREPSRGQVQLDTCCADEGMSEANVQGRCGVTWGENVCEPKFACRMHWAFRAYAGCVYVGTVFRQCIHNERVSIKGRVLKLLPQHAPLQSVRVVLRWVQCLWYVYPIFCRLIKKVRRPTSFYAWVSRFDPRKRNLLTKLYEGGLGIYSLAASAFIKREVAMKCPEMVFKDPRWIQGCPMELTVEVGPWVHQLAKFVRRGLTPGTPDEPYLFTREQVISGKQIIYTCGMNAEQVGKSFGAAIAYVQSQCDVDDEVIVVEDDQSRFDEHITKGPFLFLEYFYDYVFPRRIARKLRRAISKGFSKLGTRYWVQYTMQSGWPDTSVGDTLINAAMKYCVHVMGRNWISIVCGDDSVTVTTRKELARLGGVARLKRLYVEFGMEVDMVVRSDPASAEFCSGRFYPVGDSYVLMPKIGRLLSKLACDMVDRNSENQIAWLRGVASTLRCFGRIDPLCAALADSIFDAMGEGRSIAQVVNPYKYPVLYKHRVTPFNVLDYYDRFYGINESQIKDCIHELSQKFVIGRVYDQSALSHIVSVDI